MLIDNYNVFSDKQAITATADSTSKVHLGGVKLLGKLDPDTYLDVRVMEAFNNLTSLKAEVFQSDTENGAYTAVPGMNETMLLAALTKNAKFLGLCCLGRSVTKPWLKITFTVTGTTPTTGKISASLVRERQDSYEAGQYIDKGRVIG